MPSKEIQAPHCYCPRLGIRPPATATGLFSSAWDYFTSIPEWDKILNQKVPGTGELIPFVGQGSNPQSPHHDQLMGNLLRRPDGVRHSLSCFITEDDKHLDDPTRPLTETYSFFSLGQSVAGHKDLVHGGMIMTLFDEGTGRIIEVNWLSMKDFLMTGHTAIFTAGVNVKFKRPLQVNSDVCVHAKLHKIDDKRLIMLGEMRGPKGELYATAEITWVKAQMEKANL